MSQNLLFPHLVLGGCRSGKSRYAEQIIHELSPPYIYVATAQALDAEMEQRIRVHKKRRGNHWKTVESPFDLIETLKTTREENKPVLVDCLTLWLSNLLLHRNAARAEQAVEELASVLPTLRHPVVLVANEVGSGIVPDNNLARLFRDLAGFTNQRIAAICQRVTLMVAGIPVPVKPHVGSVDP